MNIHSLIMPTDTSITVLPMYYSRADYPISYLDLKAAT